MPLTMLEARSFPPETPSRLPENFARRANESPSSTTTSDNRSTLIVTFPHSGVLLYLMPTSDPSPDIALRTTGKSMSFFKQPGLMTVVFVLASVAIVALMLCVWSLMRRNRERREYRQRTQKYFISRPLEQNGSDGSKIFIANIGEDKMHRLTIDDQDKRALSGTGQRTPKFDNGTISGDNTPYLPSRATSRLSSVASSGRAKEPSLHSAPGTDTGKAPEDGSGQIVLMDEQETTAATDTQMAYDGAVFEDLAGAENGQLKRLSAIYARSGRFSNQEFNEVCFTSFAPPDGFFLTAMRTRNPYNNQGLPRQGNESILSLPLAGTESRYSNLGRSRSLPLAPYNASATSLPSTPRDVRGNAYINRSGSNNSGVSTNRFSNRALSISSNVANSAPLGRAISDISNVLTGTSMGRALDNTLAGEKVTTSGGMSLGDISNAYDGKADGLSTKHKSLVSMSDVIDNKGWWMSFKKTKATKPDDLWSENGLY